MNWQMRPLQSRWLIKRLSFRQANRLRRPPSTRFQPILAIFKFQSLPMEPMHPLHISACSAVIGLSGAPSGGRQRNWNLLVDTTDELSHQRWGSFLDLTAFSSTDLRGRWRLGSPMRTAPQLEFINPQQIQLVPSAGSFNLSTIATSPDSVTMRAATTNATTVGRSVLMRSAGQGTAALSLDAEF